MVLLEMVKVGAAPKQAAFGGGQPNHRKSEDLSLEAVEFVGFAALEEFQLRKNINAKPLVS